MMLFNARLALVFRSSLAEADVLRRLLAVYLHIDSSEDLKTKAKRALKSIIQKCTYLPSLEPLLQEKEVPSNILKYVVQQFAKCYLQTRRRKNSSCSRVDF